MGEGFHQEGDISTVDGGSLKLEDRFMYLDSSISSIGNGINMNLVIGYR